MIMRRHSVCRVLSILLAAVLLVGAIPGSVVAASGPVEKAPLQILVSDVEARDGQDYPVASKSGWTNTVFHDMAIVYADSPYILIILSQRANHSIFREISREFQRFNDTWFVS